MSTQLDPAATEARVPLSRDRVLHAAADLADEGGLEALSMRRLAQSLGVEAMSLYHHVRNKGDLLGGMLDIVYAEVEPPSGEGDWRSAMRRSAISFQQVLMRHPWACSLTVARSMVGPAKLRYVDSVVGSLREAAFSIQMAHHAMHAIESHIFGFTLQELSFPFDIEELGPEVAAILLRRQMVDEYPYISEVVLESIHDDRVEFEFVLDLILDGLERVRDTA